MTRQIDEAADELIREKGAVGLFKNYPTYKPGEGFPGHLCISVNDVVVHGIADDGRVFFSGDAGDVKGRRLYQVALDGTGVGVITEPHSP